jgi:hypothetical protein
LSSLRKPELQTIAKELGLQQNGTKRDLISRILAAQGQDQPGNAVAEALDASETNTSLTQNRRHEQAAVIRPDMPPPSRTASASSECQPPPAAASPRRSSGALPRTGTVDQASRRELHPSEASSPLRASGGLFPPMVPSGSDKALERTPTTDQASRRESQQSKASWLLSPIHYSIRPTQPDESDTHVYKALVVSMSGRRSSGEKHIRTHELVEKLEKQMMRTNPKNGDGIRPLDEQLLWSLSPPDFIFNVTGTADSRPGDPQLDAIKKFKKDWPQLWYYKRLKDYVAQVMFGIAAEHKSCWMMDGGTNAGIMALLGAMHKNHFYKALHSANDFPLIGFSDLSTLDKRDSFPDFPQFTDGRFAPMENAFQNSKRRYKPDAHHTHHVHVHSTGLKCDTGKGDPHEHHFLLQFSRHLAQRFTQCPMVRRRGINAAFHVMFVTLFTCPCCCWWRHWIFEKHRERAASRGEFAHQTHFM